MSDGEESLWFKVCMGVAATLFILGFFFLALAYTGWGWSTILFPAWVNSTCVVQGSFAESMGRNDRVVFQVSSPENSVFRQAATVSFYDAFFFRSATAAQLAEQIAYFSQFNSANQSVSCLIPPVTIKYQDAPQRRGYFAFHGVNSRPNFVVLQMTVEELDSEKHKWEALLITGCVLIGVGFLMGIALFLVWWFVLRDTGDKPDRRDYRKSWMARMPQ